MTAEEPGQLRKDVIWNSASSIMYSVSSVVLLLVVTRWLGLAAGGVFSTATMIGQQMQTIGGYEVRPFHSTDVRERFSFGTYLSA